MQGADGLKRKVSELQGSEEFSAEKGKKAENRGGNKKIKCIVGYTFGIGGGC